MARESRGKEHLGSQKLRDSTHGVGHLKCQTGKFIQGMRTLELGKQSCLRSSELRQVSRLSVALSEAAPMAPSPLFLRSREYMFVKGIQESEILSTYENTALQSLLHTESFRPAGR